LGLILAPTGDRASYLALPPQNHNWAAQLGPASHTGPRDHSDGECPGGGKSPPSKPLAPGERARPPPTTAGGTQGPQTQPPERGLTTRPASLRKLNRVHPWAPQHVGADCETPTEVEIRLGVPRSSGGSARDQAAEPKAGATSGIIAGLCGRSPQREPGPGTPRPLQQQGAAREHPLPLRGVTPLSQEATPRAPTQGEEVSPPPPPRGGAGGRHSRFERCRSLRARAPPGWT